MGLQVKAKCAAEEKHDYDINSIITLNDCVYSGADDGKIIKWDRNLKKLGEVQAHQSSIYSLTSIGETIYSCSNDGTVKSWTNDLKEKATIIEDSTREFWKLAASDGMLFAGDDQGTIRTLVDDKPKAQYEILEGIKDLSVFDKTLYTGKDIDITITAIGDGPKPTFATKKVIQGRAPLTLAGDKLIFVDSPATGILIHLNSIEASYKSIASVPGAHSMIINAVAGNKDQTNSEVIFYSGSWDKTIKKWKVSSDKCEFIDTVDVSLVVNALHVDKDGCLFAGLSDGFICHVA